MSRIISANKLNRFWKNGILPIKNLITNKIKTKDDLMANTVEGYIPDALVVKQGFQELNDSLGELFTICKAQTIISIPANGYIADQIVNIPVPTGYSIIAIKNFTSTSRGQIPISQIVLNSDNLRFTAINFHSIAAENVTFVFEVLCLLSSCTK